MLDIRGIFLSLTWKVQFTVLFGDKTGGENANGSLNVAGK